MNTILATNSGALTLTYTNGTWVLYDSGRDLSAYADSDYYIRITDTNGNIIDFKICNSVGSGVYLYPISGMSLKITVGQSISINIDGTAIEIDSEDKTTEEIIDLLVDAINNADLGIVASEDAVLDATIIINGSDGEEHIIGDDALSGFNIESIASYAITEGRYITDSVARCVVLLQNLLPKGKFWNRV